jgi:hypothetical protein
VLFINRDPPGGRVQIADFRGATPPNVVVAYYDSYGMGGWLDGWHDWNDLLLVGDFLGRGHDQLLIINRDPPGGRVQIADFRGATPPKVDVAYYETYGMGGWLDGWHDSNDLVVAGDFISSGHDQLLFINRDPPGGRLQIASFRGASPPNVAVAYYENWGDSTWLDGWHDAGDLVLPGRFLHRIHDQLLFINHDPGAGRGQVVEFNQPGGAPGPSQAAITLLQQPNGHYEGRHDLLPTAAQIDETTVTYQSTARPSLTGNLKHDGWPPGGVDISRIETPSTRSFEPTDAFNGRHPGGTWDLNIGGTRLAVDSFTVNVRLVYPAQRSGLTTRDSRLSS